MDSYAQRTACEGGNLKAMLNKENPRPCISDTYLKVTYNSFVLSMKCLGIHPKEIFPIINVESNFHVNIANGSGSMGVGQLTPESIDQGNLSLGTKQKLAKYLEQNESCRDLKKIVTEPMISDKENNCSRYSITDGNPAKNFLYSGLHFLYRREY